jgi:hypothetical protein
MPSCPICRLPDRSNLGRVEVRWPGSVRETGSWPAMDRHHYSNITIRANIVGRPTSRPGLKLPWQRAIPRTSQDGIRASPAVLSLPRGFAGCLPEAAHNRVSGLDLPVARSAAPRDRVCYRDRGNQPIRRTFCTYGNVRLRTYADLHFWQRIYRAESSFVSLSFAVPVFCLQRVSARCLTRGSFHNLNKRVIESWIFRNLTG